MELISNLQGGVLDFIKEQLGGLFPPDSPFRFEVNAEERAENEIFMRCDENHCEIVAGNESDALCGLFAFLEKQGFYFGFAGDSEFPDLSKGFRPLCGSVVPAMRVRGIRMHLNFVQDQSCFSEEEFERFIDSAARMKFNSLLFHMYNCQEWFPFSYRGKEHLDLSVGNLKRKPLRDRMIGREKILVKEHWFPREFEEISDTRALRDAMYARYRKMMRRAKERSMKVAVSFEPETLSQTFENSLKEWCEEDIEINRAYSLANDWQQNWSGQKLLDADVRNPVVRDIALKRAAAIVRSFPALDELHFISREGTAYRCGSDEEYRLELDRIAEKFGFSFTDEDFAALEERVKKPATAMNATCDPYWTVREGENRYAVVTASLRFVELALDLIKDEELACLLNERKIAPVVTLYQPDPVTISLVAPKIAAMLKGEIAFHYLGDYGAKDIAERMDNVRPLLDAGNRLGCISWLEFDGSMMLLQSWCRSIAQNVVKARAMGVQTMYFNHWRVRDNEHNAKAAAEACFYCETDALEKYCAALFPKESKLAVRAFDALERATVYVKDRCFNIGFTSDWVVNICTEPPGYSFESLKTAAVLFQKAYKLFSRLAECAPSERAVFLRDMCRCSCLHLKGVKNLQLAKLPLVGFQCLPLGENNGNAPPRAFLKVLKRYAEKGLDAEYEYMRLLAAHTRDCDQQGQLAMHQQGLIEPFEALRNAIGHWENDNVER